MAVQENMEIKTVEQWHEALNAGDTDRLVGLSYPDVEMGGPRGVVEAAEWRSPETGEVIGEGIVGSVFVVRGSQVASVARHEDFAGALDAAGLKDSHEAKPE